MIEAIRADNSGPTISTRNLALLHTAIHDAVNAVVRAHQPYRFQPEITVETSPEAAAAGAGFKIFVTLYPGMTSPAETLRNALLAALPHTAARDAGLALGESIAALALADRAGDGANTEVPYVPDDAPGEWRRTPPFFRPPLTPHWRYVKPFTLPEVQSFLPPPPPALDSAEYARDLEEVRMLGRSDSVVRTPEQGEIAVFWSDFSHTSMPPGHWHLIAADIARDRGNTLVENARLFALLSLSQADAAIVCWEAKYRYNLWRPVTAIQRADEDGNPDTTADPGWDHFLAAPPFPSYTSGHSTFSAAAARVLARFYGTDAVTFTVASDSLPGVTRMYHSLAACADEVGMSRIYGGIHFRFDNTAGKASGRKIADHVVSNHLLPLTQLPQLNVAVTGDGTARLRLHGVEGRLLVLEESVNLKHWTDGATNPASLGGVLIEFPIDASPARFHRVREATAPAVADARLP